MLLGSLVLHIMVQALEILFLFLYILAAGVQMSFFVGFVDVRDVAFAHVQAFEVASASGRYCLVGHDVNCVESVKILRQIYPSLSIPKT